MKRIKVRALEGLSLFVVRLHVRVDSQLNIFRLGTQFLTLIFLQLVSQQDYNLDSL